MDELRDSLNLDIMVWSISQIEYITVFNKKPRSPMGQILEIPTSSLISYNGFICSETTYLKHIDTLIEKNLVSEMLSNLAGLNPIRYNFPDIKVLYNYAMKEEVRGLRNFLRLLFIRDVVYYLKDKNKLSILYYKNDKLLTDTVDFILSRSYFGKDSIRDTWRFIIGRIKADTSHKHDQYFMDLNTIEMIKEGLKEGDDYYIDNNRNIRIRSNNTREIQSNVEIY